MTSIARTYDVFISHSATDARLALDLANACRASGLDAVTYTELLSEDDASDALWEALAESQALLAVLSAQGPTPAMAIELGAARAWNKPIFGVVVDSAFVNKPPGLADILLYPSSRIDDVIRQIKLSGLELTDDDRTRLGILYAGLGVSVDQLALDPRQLGSLVRRFHASTKKAVSGERLLSELLRMRKQGRLLKSRRADRPKSRKGTA